jgi:hypothetical protein
MKCRCMINSRTQFHEQKFHHGIDERSHDQEAGASPRTAHLNLLEEEKSYAAAIHSTLLYCSTLSRLYCPGRWLPSFQVGCWAIGLQRQLHPFHIPRLSIKTDDCSGTPGVATVGSLVLSGAPYSVANSALLLSSQLISRSRKS